MRVGVGALTASIRPGVRQSGVHRYASQLVAALPAALGDDELVVYSSVPLIRAPTSRLLQHQPLVALENPAARATWEQFVLPARLKLDRIDLYHGLAFALPRVLPARSVVTIHDLAFLRWPEQVPGRRSVYLRNQVRHAVSRAERIIAVSAHTRRDIVDLLEVPEERIDVTPLGVDPAMTRASPEEISAFRARNGLDRPFILSVGNLEPRKNLESLVRAFGLVGPDIPHELVLVGAEGWKLDSLHTTIAASPSRERIRLMGFVDPALLPLWYSSCELFVIPSLYEGFGLTLLEAMACGAPAIAADRGALPETGGDAVILSAPDPDSLAGAIRRLTADAGLRELVSAAGVARARQFTWQRTAELTVQSYRKAMA